MTVADRPGRPSAASSRPAPRRRSALTLDFGTATKQAAGAFTHRVDRPGRLRLGKLYDVSIGEDGLVTASFSDGTTQALGKLAARQFLQPGGPAPARRRPLDGHRQQRRRDRRQAGEDGFGRIQSGALERANVDITEELVSLIAAQRNFQANAKAIETANAMAPVHHQPAQLRLRLGA